MLLNAEEIQIYEYLGPYYTPAASLCLFVTIINLMLTEFKKKKNHFFYTYYLLIKNE